MSIEAGLSAYLLQNALIAVYVSNRVYAVRLPEPTTASDTTMPCVIFTLISEDDLPTHDRANLYRARIQIDAWAQSYKSAHDTAAAVHDALQGYRGAWGENVIGSIIRARKSDSPAPDVKLHRVSMDYVINYS